MRALASSSRSAARDSENSSVDLQWTRVQKLHQRVYWSACGLACKLKECTRFVAQISNLLYRSASSLRVPRTRGGTGRSDGLPIGNRRYSATRRRRNQNPVG